MQVQIWPFLLWSPPESGAKKWPHLQFLASTPRTEMAPRGHLVSEHLPAGLWASWGSPHPPGSPPLRDSEDRPVTPLRPPFLCVESGGLGGLPGPDQPGATREGAGVLAQRGWGSSQAAASRPCPHLAKRRIRAGGHSGWLPTPRPPPPGTFILHKRLVPSDKLIHTATGFVCGAWGPEAIWGAARHSGQGSRGRL